MKVVNKIICGTFTLEKFIGENHRHLSNIDCL
jgi:hypothetical protein